MKRTQYMIKESDKNKRKEFYNYIVDKYNLKIVHHNKEELFKTVL